MTKRKPISERMKIDSLLLRGVIGCHVCHMRILPGQRIIWDHVGVHAIDGKHDYKAIGPIHDGPEDELQCNKRKTFGTKATTAGSDIHKIAKVKRIAKGKMAVNWRDDGTAYYVPAKRKRKLKGRGFQTKPEGYRWWR